mmetsp:Transcript_16284/g.24429  ORF Transcript_16284/g.24429 Transcript_16284/m.24429 type:complete len:893 (+) Transcript_16284:130-2808(+)
MMPFMNALQPKMLIPKPNMSYQEDRQLYDWIKTSNWDRVESILHSEDIVLQDKVKMIIYQDEFSGRNALLNAIEYDAPLSIIKCITELIGSDGRAIYLSLDRNGNNAFHTACTSKSPSFEVLQYIAEKMEGQALLEVNNHGDSSWHLACRNSFLPLLEIKLIAEVILRQGNAGEALLLETNNNGDNAFHCVCSRNASLGYLQYIYEVMESIEGGEQILFEANNHGDNPLHIALTHSDVTLDIIKFIVDMMQKRSGSRSAITSRNNNGDSAFHFACRYSSSFDVITYITVVMEIQLGGKEVFYKINKEGNSAFHLACANKKISLKGLGFVIDLMQEYPAAGMRAMFSTNKNGRYKFLDSLVPNKNDREKKVEMCHFVLSNCNKMSQSDVSALPPETKDLILKIPQRIGESLIYEKLMKQLMNAKFTRGIALPILMMDMYVQLILIVLFSWFIVPGKMEQPHSFLLRSLLTPCTTWLAICEVTELFKTGQLYVLEIYNIVDVVQIIVVAMTIYNLNDDKFGSLGEQTTLLVATYIVWTRILFVLGNFYYSIAVFNTALFKILAELVPFLVTTTTVILAFAHMFYLTGPEDESLCANLRSDTLNMTPDEFFDEGGWTCTWYNSYVSTFHMMLSGEWHFLNDFPPTRQSVLSMVYAFVIGIILLNIIIAVISIAFQGVSENIDQAFWSQRYRFLIGDVLSMVSFFRRCCGKDTKEDTSEPSDMSSRSNDRLSIGGRKRSLLLNPISRIKYIKSNFLDKDIDNLEPLKWSYYFLIRNVLLSILVATTPCFFVAGALTFGSLWPNDMKEALLFGPTTRRIETTFLGGLDKIIEKEESILKADFNLLSTKFDELSEQNEQLIEVNRQLKESNKEMKKEVSEIRAMLELLIESAKNISHK